MIAAREIAHEINVILAKALHDRGMSLKDLAPDIEGHREMFDAMPSFDVWVTMKAEYHRDPSHQWTRNDICDIQAMAATVPYCDVVVTDKEIASHATRSGLDHRLNTVVLSNLADLLEHL